MLLSSLRASLASQQPDRLIQGSLCYTRTSTSNHPRCSHLGQRAITPNFFRTYKTLIFLSCLDNNTLCNLLSKLYHIIAHPPLGAPGAERGAGPRGCSNSSPTLSSVTLSQLSTSTPPGNVELSMPASNNCIWLSLRTQCVPPLPPPFAVP